MPSQNRRPNPLRAGAFTLIELLVVIVVISVLLTLVIAVGSKVTGASKANLTGDLIRTLDMSLESYMGDNNSEIPPASVLVRELNPGNPDTDTIMPIIDGVSDTSEGLIVVNSVGLYLRAIDGSGAGDELVRGINAKHVRLYAPTSPDDLSPATSPHPELTTVFDAWDQPIRFVHPKFHGEILEIENRPVGTPGMSVTVRDMNDPPNNGFFYDPRVAANIAPDFADIRRNFITTADREADADLVGDGDGGICVGGRPYFYSMGPDADPSKRDDNVYSTEPQFLEDRE